MVPLLKKFTKNMLDKGGIIGDISKDHQAIKDYKKLESDEQTASILNSIYDIYGHSSAYDLMKQTHKEKPWQETKQSEVISDDKIMITFLSRDEKIAFDF